MPTEPRHIPLNQAPYKASARAFRSDSSATIRGNARASIRMPSFIEVAKEGIALYDADDKELGTPKPKTPQQALETAREYFEEYLASSMEFFEGYQDALARSRTKKAAFDLHQATERLYQCLLLTLTFYTPYDHNIIFLRSQAGRLDHSLFDVWPRGSRKERAAFQKLKDAYVKARYSKHYRISKEELEWLGSRVEELGRVVHAICTAHIAAMEKALKD